MNISVSEKVVDAIYDAAVDRTLWPEALSRVSAEFRGAPTQISIYDLENGTIPLGIGVEFEDGVWEIASRFSTPELNPQLGIAMRIPLHQAVDQGAALGIDYFKSLEIYADLYRPQKHMPLFGTVVVRSETAFGGIAVMRPEHWEQASAQDLALAGAISRHIGRAVELSGLFDAQRGTLGCFEAALRQASMPILLLNTDGGIAWMNPAADTMLNTQRDFVVSNQRLSVVDPASDAKLSLAIANAGRGQASTLNLRRRGEHLPTILNVSPLWRTQLIGDGTIFLQFVDHRPYHHFDETGIAELFHLTAAEARVACAVCSSQSSLPRISEWLGISINTVKTLLQRVYDKTGFRSRAEMKTAFGSALQNGPTNLK
jgi:DNA-binding CsgD family transcriptional regulator